MTPDDFVTRWEDAGGSERQNSQTFLNELCDLLAVPRPAPGDPDYAFERSVEHTERGVTTRHFIDLYRRGAFILESKQSQDRRRGTASPAQGSLMALPDADAPVDTPAWQRLMRRAFNQARGYVADLPADHAPPPFLILVDVGRMIEVHADFSGRGRNYAQFPDRRSFQIPIPHLRDDAVRDRLRAVWTDPASLDPARHAAAVTKDVAERLARVAAALERRHDPAEVSGFLMRCLFTMFAEDVGLLPEGGFTRLLADLRARPASFAPALEALWRSMDEGGYDGALGDTLRRFNGGLFADRTALPLDADAIGELAAAARRDWRDVEPAIFGTLLERALDPRERGRLGAHYTPRAYVERLVVETVIDPLRERWDIVQTRMDEAGDAEALRAAQDFHHRLCTTRVLDPACGTGNFLYVALEMMKRLEGEVLDAVERLGGGARLSLAGETVEPSQFLGLELNPRAAAIAEVVLWVGYLKWQLRTGGLDAIPDPVLRAHGNVECRDAVLAFDARTPLTDAAGNPVTVWDGHTTKPHPVTGLPVPDAGARVRSYRYDAPRRADWPEAEFVVGNPPFIGGKDLRAELGDGYAEAVWKARPEVPGGADFVMQWWDEAARRLTAKGSVMERFGFITTNSVTQAFSRRVMERHLKAKTPVSLAFAVADHPWVKGSGRAAVRIAMTVARRGRGDGVLGRVASEDGLNSDAPMVRLDRRTGPITAKLTLGADLHDAQPLLSNDVLSFKGYMPYGRGFWVRPSSNVALRTIARGGESHVPKYVNGSDLTQRTRNLMALDFYGLQKEELREKYPEAYQHLLDNVKPERDENKRRSYRKNWWLFAEARPGMRAAINGLTRYIGTTETARHRTFRMLENPIAPDQKLRVIASEDFVTLSLLNSRIHVCFAIAAGARQGVGNDPVYNNSVTFDPFPFPALLTDPDPDAPARASLERLRDLGTRLERLRDDRLAADRKLTLTGLYNRLERRRAALHGGDPLTDDERDDHSRHHVPVLQEIHDDIDRATLHAYGWDDLAPALVGRPGATMPVDGKASDQEAAEDALLSRLVDLNRERRAEEAAGHVRWLRPAYQIPKLRGRVPEGRTGTLPLAAAAVAVAPRPWPDDPLDQIAALRAALTEADAYVDAETLARAFQGRLTPKRRDRVARILGTLADHGMARAAADGATYAPRR